MSYTVCIEKDEDFGFLAHCPSIPGCHSQGETIEDALENIRDAIRGCLDVLGIDGPTPSAETLTVHVAI